MPKFLKEVKLKQVSEDLSSEMALIMVADEVRKRNLGDLYLKNVPVSIPGIFTAPNPITAANSSLSFSLANQTQRHVFAGPTSANGTPSFRALESADISDIASIYVRKAVADTISANHNFTSTSLTFSAHYYHNMYDSTSTYVHLYPGGGNGANVSIGNFRAWNGAGGFRTFQISGNGTLQWSGTNFRLGDSSVSNQDVRLAMGASRTDVGNVYIDLIGDTSFTNYGLRVFRGSGTNANSGFNHRGTGAFRINNVEAARFEVFTSSVFKFVITDTGAVGIRETAPTRGTLEIKQIADNSNGGIGMVNAATTNALRMFIDSDAFSKIWSGQFGTNPLYLNSTGSVILGNGTDTGDILQATGSINYTSLLKVSGNSGTDGQFLKRNATTNIWSNLSISDISNFGSSGSYIQNQLAAAQNADMWISGIIRSTGELQVGSYIGSSSAAIRVGKDRTADGVAVIDLISDTLGASTTFGFRLQRIAGPNGNTNIGHRGTGPLNINLLDGGYFMISATGVSKLRFYPTTGNFSISGNTTDSGIKLDVDGDINYTTLLKVSGNSGSNGQYLKRTSTSNVWSTIDAADITGLNVSNWNTAFSWGNHAGLYRSSSWVPSWADVTGKPSTFAPSAHTLDSHSNVAITANAAGEILKWSGTQWINNTLAEAGIAAASHTHTVSQLTDYVADWAAKYNAKITGSAGVLPKFGASNTLVDSNIIESAAQIFLGWNMDYSTARIQTHLPVNIGSPITNYNLLINEGNGQGMMLRGYVSGVLQGELSFGSPAGGMQVNMPTGGNYQLSINGFPKYKLIANGHHHFGSVVSDNTYTVQIASGTSTGDGLHVQGNVATTGDFKAISDRRTKDKLTVIKDPLDMILQISGYTYYQFDKWKYGNISQEVQKIMPHAVSCDKDGILMLNYNALSALYTEAIKELVRKVKALEKEVETLNAVIK